MVRFEWNGYEFEVYEHDWCNIYGVRYFSRCRRYYIDYLFAIEAGNQIEAFEIFTKRLKKELSKKKGGWKRVLSDRNIESFMQGYTRKYDYGHPKAKYLVRDGAAKGLLGYIDKDGYVTFKAVNPLKEFEKINAVVDFMKKLIPKIREVAVGNMGTYYTIGEDLEVFVGMDNHGFKVSRDYFDYCSVPLGSTIVNDLLGNKFTKSEHAEITPVGYIDSDGLVTIKFIDFEKDEKLARRFCNRTGKYIDVIRNIQFSENYTLYEVSGGGKLRIGWLGWKKIVDFNGKRIDPFLMKILDTVYSNLL